MIDAVWVVGLFNGVEAKSVLAHAHAGVGYFILESSGKNDGLVVSAAFRKPLDEPVPHHLKEVTDPYQIAKLEKMRKDRQGLTK